MSFCAILKRCFKGDDSLTGGAGRDIFWFTEALCASTKVDRITDFVSDIDKLQLNISILIALDVVEQLSAADPCFWSNATGVAHDATDRLIYNTATGGVSYDVEGSSLGLSSTIAILGVAIHPVLNATDINIV